MGARLCSPADREWSTRRQLEQAVRENLGLKGTDHESGIVYSMLCRCLLSGGGHRHAAAIGTAGPRGRLSARSNLLRPDDGEQREPERRSRGGGIVRRELQGL